MRRFTPKAFPFLLSVSAILKDKKGSSHSKVRTSKHFPFFLCLKRFDELKMHFTRIKDYVIIGNVVRKTTIFFIQNEGLT